jgi:hypothetical protein
MEIIMEKKNGGPAFPVEQSVPLDSEGMTLRDYFAAKVVPGLIITQEDAPVGIMDHSEWAEQYAQAAYIIADAMLKERKE